VAGMSDSFISFTRSDRTVTITLNRPDIRNAITTHQDCRDLVEAIQHAQDDHSVSCIILTGAGAAFSAGGNLKAMKERAGIGPLDTPAATRANYRRGVQAIIRALWDCEVPTLAAINGHAIGLGLDIACLCDIRIAAEQAKFASSFIKVGIVPGDGGAWILPRAVGSAKAAELIFTGDTYDAAAALAMGLVSQVVAGDRLMSTTQALAARIASNPAKTLRLTKRLLREGQQQRLADVLELSAAFQALAHETADHAEAVEAFIAKRQPKFTGC
jgi:2-(1,2-epoxy-1,2-dihydrophenyl)acetyl-CoA isomerase